MLGPIGGYTVGVTADRRAAEQIAMLRAQGAECLHGAMLQRTVLLADTEIRSATKSFVESPPDLLLLSTGNGIRGWLDVADSISLGDELRAALAGVTVLSRGPKATGAAAIAGLRVNWTSPSASSTELLDHVRDLGVAGKRVAVQVVGAGGQSLLNGVAALGAQTMPIVVYNWSLPDDPKPAERLLKAVCDGQVDAVTFTSRPAVENLVEIASSCNRLDEVVAAFAVTTKIFCTGPMVVSRVRELNLGRAHQSDHPRLGSMVRSVTATLARQSVGVAIAGHQIEVQGRVVSIDGSEPTRLTGRERQLLLALLERPGAVCSKPALLRTVWGESETDPHVVEVTIGRLRQRLGAAGVGVETVMRRGYRVSTT